MAPFRYQGRLKAWIARFRGVATKYLDRYLTWHMIDERVQRLTAAKARAVLVGNTAELRRERLLPELRGDAQRGLTLPQGTGQHVTAGSTHPSTG